MVKVPNELAVLALATREVESGPTLDIVWLRNLLVAVILVDFSRQELLRVVGGSLVIQDSVDVGNHAVVFERLDAVDELLLGTPLGADGTLLVELSEVPEVVDAVTLRERKRRAVEECSGEERTGERGRKAKGWNGRVSGGRKRGKENQ